MARWLVLGIVFLVACFTWDQQSHRWLAQPASVNALYYNNRNECNSVRVNYYFTFAKDHYTLHQQMWLRPTRSVSECFFYMDMDFQLYKAELQVNGQRQGVVLEFMPDHFVARIMNGSWMEGAQHYMQLSAKRPFKQADEGIVFRTFRHTETRVK